ncbi:hypothetical protein [Desulfonatronum sp. SC1]|uniref:hypothetical protein n=1 Tax=Desulfonatronum sp. SC1 TaxID=2109626 RepID=UPI000D305930|nr:hypothetical protein [Desulfonatronum sp. SC1]PTN31930.1 hypothetical protein C6366_17270 [Desulfonatronum sp. SC1]
MTEDDNKDKIEQTDFDDKSLIWDDLERELGQSVQLNPLQADSDFSHDTSSLAPPDTVILAEQDVNDESLHLDMEASAQEYETTPSPSSAHFEDEDPQEPDFLPVPLNFTVIHATSNTVVLEQGPTLAMIRNDSVAELATITNCPDHSVYLADLDQSFGLQNITGDPKYAAILIRKELEDKGELTTEGKLFVHDVRKIESTQSVVLYSIFPRQKYMGLATAYQDHPLGFVLYDPVGLLSGLLRTMPTKQTHALALRMATSFFLMVGKRDEVMLVRRYILFGQDEQSLTETIQAMDQDLTEIQGNLGVQIKQLDWIETLCDSLDIHLPTTRVPVSPWPVVQLKQGEQAAWSALPDLAHRIPVQTSVGPREELYLKPLDTAVNWLLAAGILLTLAFLVGSFLYKPAPEQLRANMGQLESALYRELETLHAMEVQLGSLDAQNFLFIAEAVEQATLAPTMGKMWNMLAEAKPPNLYMHDMELRYESDLVLVRLEGTLNEPIGRAHEVFDAYIARMKHMGFALTDQNLLIDLNQIGFILHLEWPIIRG